MYNSGLKILNVMNTYVWKHKKYRNKNIQICNKSYSRQIATYITLLVSQIQPAEIFPLCVCCQYNWYDLAQVHSLVTWK